MFPQSVFNCKLHLQEILQNIKLNVSVLLLPPYFWPHFTFRVEYKTLGLTFKALNTIAPICLRDLLAPYTVP